LNWLVKDKILAFAGPSYERNVSPEGYCTLAPADYIPYFRRRNVGLVVRLNKKMYNEQDFIDTGIDHLDAFFLDGSCPPTKILMKVLEAFEAVPADKAFAVHCKAGLGRTGTCIGAYLMKHYRFTAAEAIGWMRICRPGCVIGPQQHFLKQIEHVMWQEGETAHVKRPLLKLADSEESMATSNDDDDDAVDGRPEQAEGLLAARGRRELVTKTESRGISTQINSPSTPNGPPDKGERQPAAVVTPDAQPQTQLWCG
jgi:protein-tyrosine phosphatase